VIVLRGALDGLALAAPVGDPDWVKLRGDRALLLDGKPPALPLDSFFALNPAMPNLHRLYKAEHATIVHAAATPYRERSHFDGQDVLESGLTRPGATDSGWLNRALTSLAPEARINPQGSKAFAVGPVTPLVVRGRAPVMSWIPQYLLPASDTLARLLDLYRRRSSSRWRGGRKDRSRWRTGGWTPCSRAERSTAVGMARCADFADASGRRRQISGARMGPRPALSFFGWDTHINGGAAEGQLAVSSARSTGRSGDRNVHALT
jgi:uncharacterized protein (DUF1501 family)